MLVIKNILLTFSILSNCLCLEFKFSVEIFFLNHKKILLNQIRPQNIRYVFKIVKKEISQKKYFVKKSFCKKKFV